MSKLSSASRTRKRRSCVHTKRHTVGGEGDELTRESKTSGGKQGGRGWGSAYIAGASLAHGNDRARGGRCGEGGDAVGSREEGRRHDLERGEPPGRRLGVVLGPLSLQG